jgi:hypothetical protein
MRLDSYTIEQIKGLQQRLDRELAATAYLSQAAQRCTDILFQEFQQSLALVRMYATLPFRALPEFDRAFVTRLAIANRVQDQLTQDTLVLSLLGTRGLEPDWNDRRKSAGHLGIPLVDARFVASIPMVSRLLTEMGLGLDWVDRSETDIVTTVLGRMAGVFYVEDAASAVDRQGRRVIPAQDFVSRYGVKTVFGVGGAYMNGVFLCLLFFTKESIPQAQVKRMTPIISVIKMATMEAAMKNHTFAP